MIDDLSQSNTQTNSNQLKMIATTLTKVWRSLTTTRKNTVLKRKYT